MFSLYTEQILRMVTTNVWTSDHTKHQPPTRWESRFRTVTLHTLHSGLMESYQPQKLRDQSSRSRAQSDNTDYKLTIQLRIIMPTSVHNKIPLRMYLLGFRSLGLKYSATLYSLQYWSNINNEGNSGLNSVILCTRPICGLSLEICENM